MRKFQCSVAQKGFFAGPVFSVASALEKKIVTEKEEAFDAENEIKKFHEAERLLRKSITENNASEKNASIREIVLTILRDETFTGKIEDYIRKLSMRFPTAAVKAADEFAQAIGSLESEYLRARQEDIRGVAASLVIVMEDTNGMPGECSCICAPEISPAQLSSIDEALIGGMLTDKGSPNSHASIIAGNLQIPYLYGNREAIDEAAKAAFIIIDSETNTVITDPDEETKNEAAAHMRQISEKRKSRSELPAAPDCKTRVYANIEGPQDIGALVSSGADGVGLFRTEFLFLGKERLPDEEEQYEAYRSVLEAMGEKEVIIRTMDVGSDKKVPWLNIKEESNPALGLRGARVSLERRELFLTQIRALLRAAPFGNLKVMFPMIASGWEIDELREMTHQAAKELEKEKREFKIPSLGIMIETPAAAICAETLAEKADFFSIGTNDLTQYTLAIDREAGGLDRYFNPHHEAVFKLVAMAAGGARKHGKETGVCGQLAADPAAVKKLIQSGVNELSVAISKVKQTKILAAEAEKQLSAETRKENTEKQVPADVAAPADGRLIPMKDIPDPVFSKGTMGRCFGILPENGNVYSPVSGTVIAVADTGHAVTIRSDDGKEFLIHVGINTVTLGGTAFHNFVHAGDRVERNQLLMKADLDMIKNAGLSTMIITVLLNRY